MQLCPFLFYNKHLKGNTKGTVKNIAKFGSTLLKGIDILKKHLSKDKPDIAVIEFGENDCDFDWE
ncbi:hypothetical protein [Caldanaerobacter subterraneus]|uniref:hypothetical protein n=1 Tax=Caldanaerobacter subterraneus TaxID=911092 RepID=UPI000424EE24|nr:hypothetical protein [Caldanaerobacter subterraneus]